MTAPAADSRAEEVFAQLLESEAGGGSLDIESACRLHPDLAAQLRALHRRWSAVQLALESRFATAAEPDLLAEIPVDPEPERYAIEGEIGRGGMGVVYRVRDRRLERVLAMKVLRRPPGLEAWVSLDERRVARFLEEAKIAGRLGHPGIVPVHELARDADGQIFFTMPLVEGIDFARVLAHLRANEADWNRARALRVLLQVAEAVAFAHERGVIHRDLKPANVMVGRFGEVYVMDWGLARVREPAAEDASAPRAAQTDRAEELGAGLTLEGDVVGTPAYMPPEQARGARAEIDARSDVYALGAMLYDLLAGRMPYARAGEQPSAREVLNRVLAGPPESLYSLQPAPPAELIAIAERAMVREKAKRYPRMQDLAEDLRAFLEGRVVRAYETGGWAELKKWVARNRKLAIASSAALAIALSGLAAVAYVEQQRKEDVLSLSDYAVLREMRNEAELLWPATAPRVPALEEWLGRARALAARLPAHRARLAGIDERAAARRERPRTSSGRSDGPVDPAHRWTFDNEQERWEHEKLVELVDGLEAFAAAQAGVNSLAEVERRLTDARSLEERSLVAHASEWQDACDAIAADPRYGGLALEPTLGLVPVGPDPVSGLWEFAHLQSGEIPERGADGRLLLGPQSAIVLVLIPAGTTAMGSSAADLEDLYAKGGLDYYDPKQLEGETPQRQVPLPAYWISKLELRRGQWSRLSGEPAAPAAAELPAWKISWQDAVRVLDRYELLLPTEAEWERAARAGTTGHWWGGQDLELLKQTENVSEDMQSGGVLEPGRRPANPFGLHDMCGNVSEWCRDPLSGSEDTGTAPIWRPQPGALPDSRAYRGGVAMLPAIYARCASRFFALSDQRLEWVGLRPCKELRASTPSAAAQGSEAAR